MNITIELGTTDIIGTVVIFISLSWVAYCFLLGISGKDHPKWISKKIFDKDKEKK